MFVCPPKLLGRSLAPQQMGFGGGAFGRGLGRKADSHKGDSCPSRRDGREAISVPPPHHMRVQQEGGVCTREGAVAGPEPANALVMAFSLKT